MGNANQLGGESFAHKQETSTTHQRLQVVKPEPFNAETKDEALRDRITDEGAHFVRTNFKTLTLDEGASVSLEGALLTSRHFDLATLSSLGTRSLAVTLECAGNGRTSMAPLPSGEPWSRGAVSSAVWTGVPLRRVLDEAVLRDDVCELLFEGWDEGLPAESTAPCAFARSLPLSKAFDDDTLLAFQMNGRPIPPRHGGPIRLIVPGWYAVASVKWLRRITALTAPFRGHFQGARYVYLDAQGAEQGLVADMHVKALVMQPSDGADVAPGEVRIWGWAWSGGGGIGQVELSLDASERWVAAQLSPGDTPYHWTRFEHTFTVEQKGRHTVRARATDASGNVQPDLPAWNRLGYGNNAVEVRSFHVR